MNKIIVVTISVIIFFNMLLPVFCAEQDNNKVIAKNYITLRHVLAKIINQIITIMEAVLETDADISLKYVAHETIEECYAMLQLLEISVERK